MFKLVTDNTVDMPEEYLLKNKIDILPLRYYVDEVEYGKDAEMDYKEFYAKMRGGNMPTTSQVNPEEAKIFLTECAKEYNEILYLSFSSGLSGTYQSVCLAAKAMMIDHPEIKIKVVDSLSASMGEGLLLHKAVQLRDQNMGLEEAAFAIEGMVPNLVHLFTVDDLNHLYRGGRVSRTAALLGTLVGVKPLLHVDEEGHLTMLSKSRGRKKSLRDLVDLMEEKMGHWKQENREDMVLISHGDCEEDAVYLKDLIKERFGFENFMINPIGPTIGAHAGPGTVALFFMGESR